MRFKIVNVLTKSLSTPQFLELIRKIMRVSHPFKTQAAVPFSFEVKTH